MLGYKPLEREEDLAKIKKEINRLEEDGSVDERISYIREALIKYPFDTDLKLELAVVLYCKWQNEKEIGILDEVEELCKYILDNCKKIDTSHCAVELLYIVYGETDRREKAVELVNRHLAPMKFSREFVLSIGVGDGKTEYYIQDEINKLTDHLGKSIERLVLNDDVPNDSSTWDKKIEMLHTAKHLYEMIYGENMMFYHIRVSNIYYLISTYQTAQGKYDEALDSLEKMAYHSVSYDKSKENDHGKSYTSIFTDKLIYPYPNEDFHELYEHNDSFFRLERLKQSRFDCIRGDERFISVENSLKESAK